MTMSVYARPAADIEAPRGPYQVILADEPGFAPLQTLAAIIGNRAGYSNDEESIAADGVYSGEFTAADLRTVIAESAEAAKAFASLPQAVATALLDSRHEMTLMGSEGWATKVSITLSSDRLAGEPTANWANHNARMALESVGYAAGSDNCFDLAAAELARKEPVCDRTARLVEIARYGLVAYGADARVIVA